MLIVCTGRDRYSRHLSNIEEKTTDMCTPFGGSYPVFYDKKGALLCELWVRVVCFCLPATFGI